MLKVILKDDSRIIKLLDHSFFLQLLYTSYKTRINKARLLVKILFSERKGRFSLKRSLVLPFYSWSISLYGS